MGCSAHGGETHRSYSKRRRRRNIGRNRRSHQGKINSTANVRAEILEDLEPKNESSDIKREACNI
jgi:hypothetical protein